MSITKTPQVEPFPSWAKDQNGANRYAAIPTAEEMKRRSLFGIPLQSRLTGETVSDQTLEDYVQEAISEIEHELDLYITPVKFGERQDYDSEMQFFSFGYLKLNHAPILNINKFQLTFNNGNTATPALVELPLEFLHVQPQEGAIQLVPAQGASTSGYLNSLYSGLGFHAFSSQSTGRWPGAIYVEYTAGFPPDRVPALLTGLIENLAAYKFLSTLGPILFPYSSVSISIDGTSQGVGTAGPAFLAQRLGELEKMIASQKEVARGHYQKRFLIDYI